MATTKRAPARASTLARRRTKPIRRKASLKKRIKTLFALSVLAGLGIMAMVIIYLVVVLVQVSKTLPSVAEIGNFKPTDGTKIYYADNTLMAVIKTENRRPIKLDDMGKQLIDATIATEDARFFEHKGVDYHGIARALYRNVAGGELRKEGASTITQQLARNINELGLSREKKLRRKIAEAVLAVKIEQAFSKDEILEMYLNQIYYGAGAYGCEAAALTYFHKHAKNLSLGQAAMLAGLPQSPSYYSDPKHRESAYRRRDTVLQRMVDTGKITPVQQAQARLENLKIYKPEAMSSQVYSAPYAVNWIMSQVVNGIGGEKGYGQDAMLSGWSIYTTLDSRIQKAAEEALANGIKNSDGLMNQGAFIAMDPHTGYVRALVGGIDYKRDQFNVVVQGKRPPGSTFKPIVYTAAFDTEKADLDTTFKDDGNLPYRTNNGWSPKNYSGKYSYRNMTVLTALKTSTNTVAVKTAMVTGVKTVVEYAHRLGISTEIEAYPPIALGADGVRPIELCSAYSAFANGGKRAHPMVIKQIVSANGEEIIDEREPDVEDLHLKPKTIEMINEGLQEVVLHGTGTRAADVPNAHGKTGTTSEARDAWFAGYTPELAAVVWVAHENRLKNGRLNPKEPYNEMDGATGGHYCAPIWRDFMLKAIPIQQASVKAAEQAAKPEQAPDEKKPKRKPKTGDEAKPEPTKNGAGTPVDATAPTDGTQPPTNPDEHEPTPAATGDPSVTPPSTLVVPPGRSPGARNDSLSTPRIVDTGARPAAPTPPRADPGAEMITVRICADSGMRARSFCPTTMERRMRRRDQPGFCRLHKAPPGEEDR